MKIATRQRVDVLYKAFADKTRLRILHMLRGGELCVCHIVEVLDVPQPKASRHLAYLRQAGLVLARREGRWSYYRLASAKSKLHGALLDSLSYCCQEMPELLRDDERLGRKRECCD